MKDNRLYNWRTASLLGLTVVLISLSASGLLAQVASPALDARATSHDRRLRQDALETPPEASPPEADVVPTLPVELSTPPEPSPTLPVDLPTPPADLPEFPIPVPTLLPIPTLPIAIPTLPPLPTLPISLPGL